MVSKATLVKDSTSVREAVSRARASLVDREVLSDVVALCAVANEHLLVVGPPGTAKSEAVRLVARQLGGSYFEYLLGRFTEPNEVFGPIDLRRLKDAVVEVETAGMLPEADIAFLDEVFLGSTAILNTLLGILNERVFRRGSTLVDCPLRVCVGATNRLPEDPALDAFADRFLARIFIEPVADAQLEDLLSAGWAANSPTKPGPSLLPALDRLSAASRACDTSSVRPLLGIAVRRLRAAGVQLSDRRVVRSQRLVAAAAALDGRSAADASDLWVLPLVALTPDTQVLARETLKDLLDGASNGTLMHAAEEFSRGAAARADRLIVTSLALLAIKETDESLLLRVEATLREIDASFASEDLPAVRPELHRREPPLPPAAVVAQHGAVPELLAATRARVAAGAELRVCTGNGWLLVLGAAADLPWADGVTYLAWQEGLLLPTTQAVTPSAELLRRALAAQAPPGHDLVAVIGDYVLTSAMPQRAVDLTVLPA
jgi:MoxR-like ATPase